MDIDGDGVLSMYELEYFYEEQAAKMEALGIEAMSFQDCLCQVKKIPFIFSISLRFWAPCGQMFVYKCIYHRKRKTICIMPQVSQPHVIVNVIYVYLLCKYYVVDFLRYWTWSNQFMKVKDNFNFKYMVSFKSN
jgi:hypothetical protein